MRQLWPFLCSLVVISGAGCAGSSRDATRPGPRPLGKGLDAYSAPADWAEASAPAAAAPAGPLTLRSALALALMHHPRLISASWNARLGDARARLAGIRPNPEIEIEAEEVAGSDGREGFSSAEMSIRMSQLVEIGGERRARMRVGEAEARLVEWDYEAERLAVLTDTTLGFIDLLSAQEELRLARELAGLAEETLIAARERVAAGQVPPLEETRAAIELAESRLKMRSAESELRLARIRLALAWGEIYPGFSNAEGDLARIIELPPYESVRALLEQNPDLARWAQEMEQRLAALALERARRVPDLTVGVGLQHFMESNDQALILSLSLPLPLFDRNQGGLAEANYRLSRLDFERRNAELRTRAALAEAYDQLVTTREEAIGLRTEVVARAEEVFGAVQEGYRQGRLGYLEVLDGQRTLFEVRARLISVQARYHRLLAVVEGLIGSSLDTIADSQEGEQ